MQLQAYLESQGAKVADFAADIGVSLQAVDRYRHGQRIPRPEVMVRIYSVTEGEVCPNDFYNLPKNQAAKQKR